MNQFECKICAEVHPLITLIELPTPTIISKITSGEIKQSLHILGKKTFLVNKEYGLFECELSLKVNDYEDDLDLLIWIKISKEEIKAKSQTRSAEPITTLKGTLYPYLPFYKDTSNLPIEISIGHGTNDVPKVVAIGRAGELKSDFENGIDMAKVKAILMKIHHS